MRRLRCCPKPPLLRSTSTCPVSPLRQYAIKLYVFTAILLYMAGDLYVWHGWIAEQFDRSLDALRIPPGDTSPVRVEVFGEGITENQIERRTAEMAQLAGVTAPGEQARMRSTVKMDLIRSALLRIKARYNDRDLPSMQTAAEAENARLASRFPSRAIYEAALRSQGYSPEQWLDKISTRLKEEFLLRRAIAPSLDISDADVATYMAELRGELLLPAARECRQIFLSTLDRDPASVKREADVLLAQLKAGADFAELARIESEDERSAPHGGLLGKLYDTPRRPLAELPLFDPTRLPEGKPTLLQSRWGWHLMLCGPIEPPREPTEEECAESFRTAVMSSQAEMAVRTYFDTLVRQGFFKKTIKNHDK